VASAAVLLVAGRPAAVVLQVRGKESVQCKELLKS